MFGQDTIERVVQQLQIQLDHGTTSTDPNTLPTSNDSPLPTSKTFKIESSLYLSTSTLLNDIQSFADLYRNFRDEYKEYFGNDSESDHVNEIIAHEQDLSELSSVNEMNAVTQQERGVPVDPDLKRTFDNLQYINLYHYTGDVSLLDELIYNSQSQSGVVSNDYGTE